MKRLKGKSGYLILYKLTIESFEQEEYLLFSGFDDDGRGIDQETCEKLFSCAGESGQTVALPGHIEQRLQAEAKRHSEATIGLSLEQNSKYFNEAREKLEKWADDMVLSAEKGPATGSTAGCNAGGSTRHSAENAGVGKAAAPATAGNIQS